MAKRILIIEDDSDMNIILKELIQGKGYEVSNYFDGNSALKDFRKDEFALAILDYKLPRMTGLEVLESIKSIDPDIKVFMISAHGDNSIKDKAREHGVEDFLDKPFDLEVFNSLVDNYVK